VQHLVIEWENTPLRWILDIHFSPSSGTFWLFGMSYCLVAFTVGIHRFQVTRERSSYSKFWCIWLYQALWVFFAFFDLNDFHGSPLGILKSLEHYHSFFQNFWASFNEEITQNWCAVVKDLENFCWTFALSWLGKNCSLTLPVAHIVLHLAGRLWSNDQIFWLFGVI